jgi:membrane associated rhomboid family serine protease
MRSTWDDGKRRRSYGASWLPFSLSEIPVVKGLMLAAVAGFLLSFFAPGLAAWLAFSADPESLGWLTRPWTWFTWVFLSGNPLFLFFEVCWLYWIGGMLERSWASRNFIILFSAMVAVQALAFVPAAYLLHTQAGPIHGLFVPLCGLTVAWAALDPDMEVSYFFVPMRAKTLALLDVILVFFFHGASLGLFALAGPILAFLYVRKMPRLNIGFRAPRARPRTLLREEPEPRERTSGFNPLRRMQEQQEIERLRRLLGEDDEDRPARRR